jgi:hypothetical protein
MCFLHHFNRKDVEKSFRIGIAEGKKIGRTAAIKEIRKTLSGGYRDSAKSGTTRKRKLHNRNTLKSTEIPWYRPLSNLAWYTFLSGIISVSAVGLFCHSASALVWFSALMLGMCIFWALCLLAAVVRQTEETEKTIRSN